MHRVELKVMLVCLTYLTIPQFLMHRVELKVNCKPSRLFASVRVPNAPCGVEREVVKLIQTEQPIPVPNAPCGVESNNRNLRKIC